MNYHDQMKQKCFDRINEIAEHLPAYAVSYVRAKATHKDTSYKTGMAYAYDLQVFFRYLEQVKNVPIEKATPVYLGSLTPSDIEESLQYLVSFETDSDREYNRAARTEKRSPGTPPKRHHMAASARARNLSALRGLYKHMIKNGLVKDNPAALADTPKTQKKRIIRLDKDEVRQTLSNVEFTEIQGMQRPQFARRQALRDYALLSLLLFTGIRVSECVGIDLSDIDFTKNSVLVRRKGGDDESVFFNQDVADALQDYIRNERYEPEYDPDALFVSRRKERMSTEAVENVVKKYTAGVSIHKITPHKLRSTFATQLYEVTNDAMKVKDALGHKSLSVVQKYIDSAEQNRQEAAKDIHY